MYILFLCLRYIQKRRIAFFGIAAVTLCVALLIVVTSLFLGFIKTFQLSVEKQWGQMTLMPHRSIAEYGPLADCLEQIEAVQTAKAVLRSGGLLYFQRGDVRSVMLMGIDLERQCRDEAFRNGLLLQQSDVAYPSFEMSGSAQKAAREWLEKKSGGIVGEKDLAIGVIGGIGLFGEPDELTDEYDVAYISQSMRQRQTPFVLTTARRQRDRSSMGGVVRSVCWPVDAVQTGFSDADTRMLYLPFDRLMDMISPADEDGVKRCIAEIQIIARPGSDLKELKKQVFEQWKQFARDVLHWPDYQLGDVEIITVEEEGSIQMFTREIRKQLAILQLIVGFICLVAAFLVFVILYMIVMHKKRDMGIIRSLGGSRAGMARIFLGFGLLIGLMGSGLGLALGVFATQHINELESVLTKVLGFKIWKSGVYLFDKIPNEVAWEGIVWILLGGITAAVLGAVWPAVKAARQQPVVTLRYE